MYKFLTKRAVGRVAKGDKKPDEEIEQDIDEEDPELEKFANEQIEAEMKRLNGNADPDVDSDEEGLSELDKISYSDDEEGEAEDQEMDDGGEDGFFSGEDLDEMLIEGSDGEQQNEDDSEGELLEENFSGDENDAYGIEDGKIEESSEGEELAEDDMRGSKAKR